MADFGLAAQIGRGGGGGGVQQVDPANRMMQMMQLQQAQQNMMLQQELAARQRQLFPLEQEKLQQAIRTQTYLGDAAGVKSREAQRAENVYTRLLRLRQTTDPAALASPDFRTALATTDPELADQLNSIVSGAEKTKLELATAGYNKKAAEEASKKAMFSAIASTLPGIVDQSTFDAVLGEVERVDPLTVKLTGRRFTPGAKRILEKRLRGLADIKIEKDPDGNWVRIDPDANTKTVLRSEEPAPAGADFGNLYTAAPAMAGRPSPLVIGPAAASLPSPNAMVEPGATPAAAAAQPIIQPRAAPAAQPALGPAAVAAGQTEAAKLAAKRAAEQEKLSVELDTAIRELSAAAAPGGLIEQSTGSGIGRVIDAAVGFFGAATPGARAAGRLAPIADLALKLVPRFEGPQSDADVAAYNRAAGQIADTSVPNAVRQDAAKEIVRLMKKRRDQFGVREGAAPAASATSLRPIDQEALAWANSNPNDPRAAAIKQRLGVQ